MVSGWGRVAPNENTTTSTYSNLLNSYEHRPVLRFWNSNRNVVRGAITYNFYKFYSDPDNNEYNYYPTNEANDKKMMDWNALFNADDYDPDNPPPYLGTTICVGSAQIEFIQELVDMGWIELDYFPQD